MISKIIMYACLLIFAILAFTGSMLELIYAGFEDIISKQADIVLKHVGIGFVLASFIFLFVAAIIFIIKDEDA